MQMPWYRSMLTILSSKRRPQESGSQVCRNLSIIAKPSFTIQEAYMNSQINNMEKMMLIDVKSSIKHGRIP